MHAAYRSWLIMSCVGVGFVYFMTDGDIRLVSLSAGMSVAVGVFWAWHHTRGPGAALASLRRLWLELPGAVLRGNLVAVHHESQPVFIRTARRHGELGVSLFTPLPVTALAFRLWPKTGTHPPPMGPMGDIHGGPSVDRAVLVEMRFANILHAECNDEAATDRLLTEEAAMAIVGAIEKSPREFCGITYDGLHLGVHLRGSIAADPEQASALAMSVWKAMA